MRYSRPKRPVKLSVWEWSGWRCHFCEKPIVEVKDHPLPPNAATIDHLIPRSQGGGNNQENLVAACFECNQRKRNSCEFHPAQRDYTGRDSVLAAALEAAFEQSARRRVA